MSIPAVITIARGVCPKCRRPDVALRSNFTLYAHRRADGTHCYGPSPEIMFTLLLRAARLDVRPDAAEKYIIVDDPEWAPEWTGQQRGAKK